MPRWAEAGSSGADTPGKAFGLDAPMGVARWLEGHGFVVAAISRVHLVPLTQMLVLMQDGVTAGLDGGVTLRPTTLALVLPPAMPVGFRRFAVEGRLVFPGRNGALPPSVMAVGYHVVAPRYGSEHSIIARRSGRRMSLSR